MTQPLVSIHYRRLPDRETVFRQRLVEDTGEYIVTHLEKTELTEPVRIGGRVVLEPGAPAVWFTYPGRWYDIGRFHLADGTFTGFYANILTPVEIDGLEWRTTDLCLDVWVGADGGVELLDEEAFETAVAERWIDGATEAAARETAGTLLLLARQGEWPPEHVREWTLERAALSARSGAPESRAGR